MKVGVKLKNISYSGKSIGRDISIDITFEGKSLQIDKKIKLGTEIPFDDIIASLEVNQDQKFPINIKITEKDFVFNDTGEITEIISLSNTTTLPTIFEYTVPVTEHRLVLWKTTALFRVSIETYNIDDQPTQAPKKYQSYLGENYNRYDSIIQEVVTYWNNEFSNDTNPPDKLLDPNLVKAIIFQETRVGHDKNNNGEVNIMQVGNPGDPSLATLRGELRENWIHNGEQIPLKYDASVKTAYDSVYWGVRWLYHKAQHITKNGSRSWDTWKEAVSKYGPGNEQYTENVWNIYTEGIKHEKDSSIKLWILGLIMVTSAILLNFSKYEYVRKITLQTFYDSLWPVDNVTVQFADQNSDLFLSIIEVREDWSEDLHIGRIHNHDVQWLNIPYSPTENSILSARFIKLKGIPEPVLEVYGKTHVGNGRLYLYRVQDHQLSLLFDTVAVDSHNEDAQRPGEFLPKYGYTSCGSIFTNGKLTPRYRDTNHDGIAEVILSGNKEVICTQTLTRKLEPYSHPLQVKVAELPIKKTFDLSWYISSE